VCQANLTLKDGRLIFSTFSSRLTWEGEEVGNVESVNEVKIWFKNNERPYLVILDVHMPACNGLELIKSLE
jgi:DNA-binding response OmpR family regulator